MPAASNAQEGLQYMELNHFLSGVVVSCLLLQLACTDAHMHQTVYTCAGYLLYATTHAIVLLLLYLRFKHSIIDLFT